MGCGKTSIGRCLAHLLGYGFVDLDEWIEDIHESSVGSIINKQGIDAFRTYENNAFNEISSIKNHVISIGGGSVIDNRNLTKAKNLGVLIWVDVPIYIIAWRMSKDISAIKKRPLLLSALSYKDSKARESEVRNILNKLFQQRLTQYQKANLIVSDSYSTPLEYAKKIKKSIY
jgi:shikimate kinase